MSFPALLEGNSFKIVYAIILCLGITDLALKSLAWHHPSSDIYMNNRLYYKNPRNAPSDLCPRDEAQAQLQGRTCLRKCTSDEDCKSKRKKCFCDGACGFSCIKPERECGDPEPPAELGEVHITGKVFGSKAVYSCPEGYRVIGMEERVCQADGSWSGTPPACKKNIFCTQPPVIEHARHNAPIDQTTFDLDTALQYQCSAGYITKGFARTKCFFYNGTAKWFGPDITCEPKGCGEPQDILNGRREGICLHFSCKVTYVCQPGFELVGRANHYCNADGSWSPKELPTCVPVQCALPENPANGKAVFTSVSFNSVVTYECKYGYMLVGEGNRRCGPNKRWSGVEPQCKEINCGHPGFLHNGWLENIEGGTALGASIIFRCYDGMTLVGHTSSVCHIDGKWRYPIPKCLAPCSVPAVPYGNVTAAKDGETTEVATTTNSTTVKELQILKPGTSVPHGKIIGVECEEQYEPAYNITPSTCNNGSWTHAPKCQPARCKYLPKPPRHGMVIAPKTEHGMKARFTCRDGYILVGNNVTECQYGQWIGDTAICNQTYCKFPGSIPNGRVLLVGNMGLYDYRNYVTKVANNRQIMFECDRGYVLGNGPQGKTCIRGEWAPKTDPPRCIPSQHPSFRWIRSTRRKRRAIKTGSSIVRAKGGGGGGGSGNSKRDKKRKNKGAEEEEEDVEFAALICEDFEDQYIQTQVIQPGKAENQTFSTGAIVRVSCIQGFGVNLPNETITCVEGRWKPKVPQCSALPCKTPYIMHGTFYNSSNNKVYVFQEPVKNAKTIELKCSARYILKGQKSMSCYFGEWDVAEAPECVPAPCFISPLDYGTYSNGFRSGLIVAHGTEVDYTCSSDFRKMNQGATRCNLGEWKEHKAMCLHLSILLNYSFPLDLNPDHSSGEGKKKKQGKDSGSKGPHTQGKRNCDPPPKEKGAIAYLEGRPIDYRTEFSFQDSIEVSYRCAAGKPKSKNKKIKCENGNWNVSGPNRDQKCEGDPDTEAIIDDMLKMINGSCIYQKKDKHIATFIDDREVLSDYAEFPSSTLLTSRCVDIGKFKLTGAARRKCVSGQWFGISPKCEGLSQYHDLGLDKSPTILFRYLNGSIVQSNDGKLVVYPGTTLHMECLWIRKFGTPKWEISNNHRVYQEGWTTEEGRDSSLEYRLTVDNAQTEDSGTYSCVTPARHAHQINIIVKSVECKPLPHHPDLTYSTNGTILGTNVTFGCKNGEEIVGAKYVVCGYSGHWTAELPKCENVECPDISLLPAMAPLQHTTSSNNGTLKKNETAPPRIIVYSREIGGRATFTCPEGYMIQGSSEAVCLHSGEWSTPVALCKEVECMAPSPPENGYVAGNTPIKYKAGDIAQFECNQGYMMEGQSIVACQDNGNWSRANVAIKCVNACTYPGTIIGGTISQVKFFYTVSETVTFDCNNGYVLRGSRMLHCMKGGKWSTSVPTCSLHSHNDHEHISGLTLNSKSTP